MGKVILIKIYNRVNYGAFNSRLVMTRKANDRTSYDLWLLLVNVEPPILALMDSPYDPLYMYYRTSRLVFIV